MCHGVRSAFLPPEDKSITILDMVKGRKSSRKNRHLNFVVDKKFSDPAKENTQVFMGHQASLFVWDGPGSVTQSLSHSRNP